MDSELEDHGAAWGPELAHFQVHFQQRRPGPALPAPETGLRDPEVGEAASRTEETSPLAVTPQTPVTHDAPGFDL